MRGTLALGDSYLTPSPANRDATIDALLALLLLVVCLAPLPAAYAEGQAREATEIQNLQIGEGDVMRGMSIPLYMIFPRIFTCPTSISDVSVAPARRGSTPSRRHHRSRSCYSFARAVPRAAALRPP